MKHLRPIGFAGLLVALLSSCAGPAPVSTSEVQAVQRDRLPTDPADSVWDEVPVHMAELLLQDLVEPRLMQPSTPRVAVRAVTDGEQIALKLNWADDTQNDRPGASRFSDACAVQLPRGSEPDVPAPQMGEEGRIVEITFWRASWQAVVDGRPDTITSLYPNAAPDHYPFEAPSLEPGSEEQQALAEQYAPARALGNGMEGPRTRPVQDLLAEGPGTLTPMADQSSQGRGRRVGDGWEVVIIRPVPTELSANRRSQIALAVWDGEHEETGSRKMRTGWIPLHVGDG
jgi:DMSO reductase family type II enzyme heme b subunit